MKPHYLFLTILCFNAFGQSQKEVLFKRKFLPNTEYVTTMLTSSKSEVKFDGPSEMLENLKTNGVQNPILFEGSNSVISSIKTKDLLPDGSFDAVMTYPKVKSTQTQNGQSTQKDSPLDGMRIEGKYDSNNIFKVDTIIGNNVNEALRNTLTSTLENVQEQIKFPDYPLKPGSTFNQTLPMTIPVAGVQNVQIVIKTDYLLKEIKGDLATFDITQTVELDMDIEGSTITASGNGTGVSQYSISKEFITKYESNLTIELTILMNQLTISSEVVSKSDMSVEIK
ncbi:MAG: hypothetical protein HWE07_13500 [Cytophagia bacterium]|nr:hypothetical protein [Cytophagia bacterium]